MPCPTCDHALGKLFAEDNRSWFNCARCGTVVRVQHNTDYRDVFRPALVDRCRHLLAEVLKDRDFHPGAESLLGILHQLGVTEAIHTPAERPAT
jgi:hypothetical protein